MLQAFFRSIVRLALATLAFFAGASPAQPYFFSGGDIVERPEVVVVYWGDQPATFTANLNKFYSRITRSGYLDVLTEYSRTGRPIGAASLISSVQIMPGDSRTVDTLEIAREIDRHILSGILPIPSSRTVYMVHFGAAMSTVMGANILGAQIGASPVAGRFCGYHFTARTQVPLPLPGLFAYGPKIRISVIPDPSTTPAGCSGKPNTFNAVTFVSTHELVETITNPDSVIIEMSPVTGAAVQCNGVNFPVGAAIPVPPIGPGPLVVLNGQSPWAWNSSRSVICNPDEVSDQCSAPLRFRTTNTLDGAYIVSGIFLNSRRACSLSTRQGDVLEAPPPRPPTAREVCTRDCRQEQSACMAEARSGVVRGACSRQALACNRACP